MKASKNQIQKAKVLKKKMPLTEAEMREAGVEYHAKKDLAKKAASVVIGKPKKRAKVKSVNTTPCECGCKGIPSKKGSRFLRGHDMKLRSKLLKASRNGGGNQQTREKALKQLRSLGWA